MFLILIIIVLILILGGGGGYYGHTRLGCGRRGRHQYRHGSLILPDRVDAQASFTPPKKNRVRISNARRGVQLPAGLQTFHAAEIRSSFRCSGEVIVKIYVRQVKLRFVNQGNFALLRARLAAGQPSVKRAHPPRSGNHRAPCRPRRERESLPPPSKPAPASTRRST